MKNKAGKVTLKSLYKKVVSLDKKVAGIPNREEIIQFKDEILGEIRDMRNENALITGRNAINRDTLEDHEGRIIKLKIKFLPKSKYPA